MTFDALRARFILWLVTFGICFGLGYPTLNRYDPRLTANVDAVQYYNIVEQSPAAARWHWKYRVLVPYLAKPVYHLVNGRTGSWNPVFFALLVVNSMFVALTVVVIVMIAGRLVEDPAVTLLAGMLYLLNFDIPNQQLAGMVDSGEAFFMALLTWTLVTDRWRLLPVLGVIGALAKETFVPLSVSLAGLWWLHHWWHDRSQRSGFWWVLAMAFTGLATVTMLQTAIEGNLVWPWDIAASENSEVGFVAALVSSLTARTFWYVFLWQLPLTLWVVRRLPMHWVTACAGSAAIALLLGAFNNAEGNVSRAMFHAMGPLLSVASAIALVEISRRFSPRPAA